MHPHTSAIAKSHLSGSKNRNLMSTYYSLAVLTSSLSSPITSYFHFYAHTNTTYTHTHTHTHTVLVAHCQNWSRGSPRERGERLKRNLGKMTQLAIEPPNGRHPLKSPKLWVNLKMIPLMGSPHLSKWVRTRCKKRIDGIRVSVQGSNCSYPCPQ